MKEFTTGSAVSHPDVLGWKELSFYLYLLNVNFQLSKLYKSQYILH